MKQVLLISFLGYASFLVSCSQPSKSVAGEYLATKGTTGSGNVAPATDTPSTTGNETPPADGTTTDTPSSSGQLQGDASKGQTTLSTVCSGCHGPGLPGKAALTAAYIPRLDTAYTGPNKIYHQAYSNYFTGQGRADLEAALILIK